MDELEGLSHTKWECKYHVVFIPKGRRRVLYGQLRQHLGEVFRRLAQQKESRVEEGHLMVDHVHMMLSIPPKYAVSQVVGYIKGKSAIHLARVYGERKRNFVGQSFWARGYYVSTVGRDETVIREYIRNQEHEDERLDPIPIAVSRPAPNAAMFNVDDQRVFVASLIDELNRLKILSARDATDTGGGKADVSIRVTFLHTHVRDTAVDTYTLNVDLQMCARDRCTSERYDVNSSEGETTSSHLSITFAGAKESVTRKLLAKIIPGIEKFVAHQ